MFKRIKGWFPGEKKGGKKLPTPPGELDMDSSFRIAVPVVVAVPISPLDSFSERAQKMLLEEIDELTKKIKVAMFHPMPDGTLHLFVPDEVKKEVKN